MSIPASAEAMGQVFSEITVTHETRLEKINALLDAVRNLYYSIDKEIHAETLAQANQPTTPTWAQFRGNGVGTPEGINSDVQTQGEALYDALYDLTS
jgi:hypothetical protein